MTSTTSSRIWEEPPGDCRSSQHASQPATLPSIANITRELPSQTNGTVSSPTYSSNNRDSDLYPSQPQSTRSSAYSSGLTNGYYASSAIGSPHRASNSSQFAATSHPSDYSQGLPTINQHHDPNQYRDSQEYPQQRSRRSSIGSEVGQFRNLQINSAPSPYPGSTNQSTTSIQANLQRERGITPTANGVRNSRTSGNGSMHQQPLSPLTGPPERRPGESRHAFNMRTAPIISANPMREVYNADKPTAGQPYAFPDPDMSVSSGTNEDIRHSSNAGMSRRNSDHTSINSSLYTTDTRQSGSHRPVNGDDIPGTHHHSLQHRQVSQLAGESDSPDATSPYSRTPALRASHKMAERKRRTEMKYLFDSLRAQIPASHGSKSSKWEILSKASEYIKTLENNCKANQQAQGQLGQVVQDLDATRRENESLRAENQRLFHEMNAYRDARHANMVQQPMPPQHYAPAHAPLPVDPNRSLPPLSNGVHASSMQGVQYTDSAR
ncbi:MAG: hypothetical protein LQ338_007847 [Usnochroma carphineum]|nr:MAG: hypothetical protein LQ338_007847 [Usnochroma carphineum]